jgi:adenine-specific DNA-methyltransferase
VNKTILKVSVVEPVIREKLHNSLIVYFLNENYKLGLCLAEHQINEICSILLCGNEDRPYGVHSWTVKEPTVLDEYRKEELGIMDYLHLVSLDLRKQFGQFATPTIIVRKILKSIEYIPSNNIISKRLIDPACGSGVFLVEAVRIYLNALKKVNTPIHNWYQMVISAICGIDIDPQACFFARLNLATLLAPAILEYTAKHGMKNLKPLPVYCADTLDLFAAGENGMTMFYGRLSIPLKKQFDFVVGNPPYFKIKGLREDLKNVFSDSTYGHPNAYGLFIHAGIEMLDVNGRFGFIVPRSMLSGLYFKNLRNFIEKKTSIREIIYISERKKIFEFVLHGTMILSLRRNKRTDEVVNISFIQSLKEMGNEHPGIRVDMDKVVQHLNGTTVWFVADSVDTYNIINRIVREHPLLSGKEVNCCAKTGQIVWNRVKPLLTTKAGTETLPLVWATDVGRFSFSFNRVGTIRPSFLKVDAKIRGLVAKGQSILVQRITADEQPSRIVASLPEDFLRKARNGYFVENHLNIIQSVMEKPPVDLYFVLGILNSDIVEFFFRAMNGNTQVSATELNLLPMPIGKYEEAIAVAAKKLQVNIDDKNKEQLIAELNFLVAKAYGLNDKELAFVRQYLTRFKNRLN